MKTANAIALALTLATPLAVAASGAVTSEVASQTEANRAIVTDFADIFYAQRDPAAAFAKHVALDYIQHNPRIADGTESALAMLVPLFSQPGARFDVKRIIVDGDLAAIHLHGRPNPAERGVAVVDIYRLQGGKIVEHWDVIQPVPATAVSPHPLF